MRKRSREVEDATAPMPAAWPSTRRSTAISTWATSAGARQLPADQREALLLVGASGFSYEEAAEICGCAIGTIKSRVNRARVRLAEILAVDSADDFGPDARSHAVLTSGPTATPIGE